MNKIGALLRMSMTDAQNDVIPEIDSYTTFYFFPETPIQYLYCQYCQSWMYYKNVAIYGPWRSKVQVDICICYIR